MFLLSAAGRRRSCPDKLFAENYLYRLKKVFYGIDKLAVGCMWH